MRQKFCKKREDLKSEEWDKLPLHSVHGGKDIFICREGDKEGERNQPETNCEIRHHLEKKLFPPNNIDLSAHTHLTEWIIILAKVWKCQIVIDQDLGRSWNEFINILYGELSVHHFEKRRQLYHYHREDEGGRGDGEEREWCEKSKMSNLPRLKISERQNSGSLKMLKIRIQRILFADLGNHEQTRTNSTG